MGELIIGMHGWYPFPPSPPLSSSLGWESFTPIGVAFPWRRKEGMVVTGDTNKPTASVSVVAMGCGVGMLEVVWAD